jgi:hypothetical protein
LEVAVLSFNEFIGITLNEMDVFCMPKLKTLDLSFNRLIAVKGTNMPLKIVGFLTYAMFFKLETFNVGHQWSNDDEAIWEGDDADTSRYANNHATKLLNRDDGLIAFMYKYLNFLAHQCHVTISRLLLCIFSGLPFDDKGTCKLAKCIAVHPDQYNWTKCEVGPSTDDFLHSLLGKQCNLMECYMGLIFPIPEYMNKMDISHIHVYHDPNKKCVGQGNGQSLCLYTQNNLEYLDLSSGLFSYYNRLVLSQATIRGLHKLKQFKYKGNNFPFLSMAMLHDMPALEEVNLSGNNLTYNGTLPKELFARSFNIKTIDVSATNLMSIEDNSFITLHSLTSLDLSNNHLPTATFNVDLSGTNLSYLNLRNNSLSGLSHYMRAQLELLSPER